MSIKQISTDAKWKIVASSFIFNPTSAVKELLDNSIDAHARTITIDIDSKTGGCEYICVRDDGDGVKIEDREMMCLNHSTSKIELLSDIAEISTLGFRGEALFLLSTLASAQGSLEVITRTEKDSIAERWVTDRNGRIIDKSRRKIPSPKGTCITIKNLMNGLRARKKELELKASKTIKDITQLINHYSIEFRNIRFLFSLVSLSKNGSINNKQLQTSLNTDLSKVRALSNIVGLKKSYDLNFWYDNNLTINNLFSVDYIIPNMLPEYEIINKKKPFKFISINHRPLSNKLEVGHLVNKRLNNIYRSFNLVEPHVWYINFNCAGNLIDINIEPEKNNVLINNIEEIMNDFEREMTVVVQTRLDIINEGKVESEKIKFERSFPTRVNTVDNSINIENEEGEDDLSLDSELIEAFSPKEKVETNNVENTTLIGEDVEYPPLKKRRLTTESFVSEDDTNWGKLLLDENELLSNDKLCEDGDLPSSLTNNYEQANFNDDDLELSRDISLSNPFTIAKLKRKHVNKPDSNNNTLQMNSIEKREKYDQLPHRKIKPMGSTKQINPVTKQRKDESHNIPGRRKISLFSEYTNSYITTMEYRPVIENRIDPEKQWLERNKTPISDSMIVQLSEVTHTNTLELNNKLMPTKAGWYIYEGVGDTKR